MYIILFENNDEPISYKAVSEIAEGVLCDGSYALVPEVSGCISVVNNDYTVYHDRDEVQEMITEWASQEPLDERKEWGVR